MSTFQTFLALVVLVSVLSTIGQAVRELLSSRLGTTDSMAARTTLWLGAILLLTLQIVPSQTASSSPPTDAKKTTEASKKKITEKNPAEPAPGTPSGNTAAPETPKDDATKPNIAWSGNAHLSAIASDYGNISFTRCEPEEPKPGELVCAEKVFQAKVIDSGFKAQIKEFHVGDVIHVEVNDKGELRDLRGPVSIPSESNHPYSRFLVLTGCALAILGLATAATRGAPLKLIVGMDNRYSNSKFQLALWFWVVMSTYLATVVFRVWLAGWDFFGGVDIPKNLLILSGMSAITYGGAKAITTSKVNSAMNPSPVAVPVTPPPVAAITVPPGADGVTVVTAGGPAHVALMMPAANPNPKNALAPGKESLLNDLVRNDQGGFDFGDFQMVAVTLVAVAMYMTLIFHFLGSIAFLKTATLPDVDRM